jgi:hypothetical protein
MDLTTYTVLAAWTVDGETDYEEFDIRAERNVVLGKLITAARAELAATYESGGRVLAIADRDSAEIIWRAQA